MSDPPETHLPDTKPSFLKRWLGWRIIALTTALLILLAPVIYRGWRLGQVPVTGEPFDVEGFQKQAEVPDEENAAVLLLAAAEKLVKVPEADQDAYFAEERDGWDPGDATLERYQTANETALEIWRNAADCSSFQIDVNSLDADTQRHIYNALIDLYRFEVKQIEKHIATGDPQAAIPWINAMVRHSQLLQQNSGEFFSMATAYFALACSSASDWSVHPDLQRQDIDQVLAVLRTTRELYPRSSDTVKAAHLSSKQAWDAMSIDDHFRFYRDRGLEPPLGSKWRWWLEAEPQFTIRLLPFITRNHLLFIDNPRRDRPPLIDGNLFDDSSLPATKRGELDARELSKLMMQSRLLSAGSREALAGYLHSIDRDEIRYRCMIVALAAQAYFRDRGEFPEKAVELVPEYLDEIPDDLYSPTPAPLLYRRDGINAVVYSRFKNEVDDGAAEMSEDDEDDLFYQMDFGFRIRHPFNRPLAAPKPE